MIGGLHADHNGDADRQIEGERQRKVRAHGYDLREGTSQQIGEFSAAGIREFIPPSTGAGDDWVLVLDDAERGFPSPGFRQAP